MADGAGPGGRVEGKMFGRGRLKTQAAGRAVIAIGMKGLGPGTGQGGLGRLLQQQKAAFTPFEGGFDGIAQADADFFVNDQPVHNHFNGVAEFGIKLDAGVAAQFHELAVHPGADKALAGQALDDIAKFALLRGDDRGQEHDAGFRRKGQDFIHDVAGGLVGDGLAADGAIGLADMGEEKAEIIVDFGSGRDDGARIRPGNALFDGDGGREALDKINIRLLHLIEELARISRERLDILSLSLSVNCIEGQRRLARSAQAGDDHQFAARNGERQIFEIMLARPSDFDEFDSHEW